MIRIRPLVRVAAATAGLFAFAGGSGARPLASGSEALQASKAGQPGALLTPWEQTIHWNVEANADTGPWESPVLDSDGHELFRVALIPLWAVEGGVTAFEIAVTTSQNPRLNLLGERQLNVAQASVIEVWDLERGIAKSRFGRVRSFDLPMGGGGRLEVTVRGARLGRGAGMCDTCPNFQEFRATAAVRAR